MSPRRSAQLGLLSVCLVLVTSLGVLVAGTRESTAFTPIPAPSFHVNDFNGIPFSSKSFKGKFTVLYFYSVRCPVCNEYTARVTDLVQRYASDSRVQFVGIHSTAADKAVGGGEVRVQAAVSGLKFPMLDDRDGAVARKFKVSRTPTLVVLDEAGFVRYHGSIDDHRNLAMVKSHMARNAVDALLTGKTVPTSTSPEIGCTIFKNQ